tara:strand:+ start:53 stop:499 length:447 start_codon:yes stop_codon:yes gene_type:complete
MIDFSFKIINDSFRDSNLNFFKDLDNLEKTLSLTKEQKDQALREYLKQENPYYCNSIKAISFKGAIRKIEENLKQNADFLSIEEKKDLYLSLDPNYTSWGGNQLDIDLKGCKNNLRICLYYDADPLGELNDQEIEEIDLDIQEQTDQF